MRVPLSWLKEKIDLNLTPAQISRLLTQAGLEVESVEVFKPDFKNIVVAKVQSVEKHPNADKLVVAQVSDGQNTHQVVCGAPNCRAGMKTAYARVGAVLQDTEGGSFEIKKVKVRDVESGGMLCSGKELGISDDHDGIMEFDDSMQEGADIAEMYHDAIFDISLTPNLNHCASIIGVARELAALTEKEARYPEFSVSEGAEHIGDNTSVTVQDEKKCPRYACRLIKGVRVGASPYWLKKRLIDCGMRPINNIVDITNFVLLEMGHPLHAFDFDLLEGKKILVRAANEGEKFVTLDEKERTLCADDLLICDRGKGIAVAGVMGGMNSEVSEKTKNVLLESAYFDPVSIRKTSKRLGLQTESSKRFERGSDPNGVVKALDRAAELLASLAHGVVCQGVIDVKSKEFAENQVACRFSRINKVLGTQLSVSEVEKVFQNLKMRASFDGKDLFSVTVPTYRVDITEEVDLIEEVARIYGYDKISKEASPYRSSSVPHSPIYLFEKQVRDRLVSEGLQEFITCDLIGPALLRIVKERVMPKEVEIEVLNPTSIEQSVLRTSMLPGLLQVLKHNYDHGVHDLSGFEVGRVHFKDGERYKEQSAAALALTGKALPSNWDIKDRNVDFYDLKGIVENLLSELGTQRVFFKESTLKILHPGRQASVWADGREIGTMGEVHPSILRRLDLPQTVLFAEFDLHEVFQTKKQERKMRDLPVYPASERDLTITLNNDISVQKIFDAINDLSPDLLEQVILLGVYRSDKLGRGLKNVTLRFVYRDKVKTVEHEVVEETHTRLVQEVDQRLRR